MLDMGRTENRNNGFSTVEALIIVAVIGITAAGGWLVYQHNRTKVTDAAAGNQTTNQQTNTTPAPTVTYLDIKEWGVKLPLSGPIKDAYYVVATNSTDTIWIGLKSLDSAGCAAALGNTQGASAPVAAIIRVLPTDLEPVKGVPYTQLYPGVTIGGYYYAYLSGTKSKTCASQATLQSIDTAFAAAAKTAVSATVTAN